MSLRDELQAARESTPLLFKQDGFEDLVGNSLELIFKVLLDHEDVICKYEPSLQKIKEHFDSCPEMLDPTLRHLLKDGKHVSQSLDVPAFNMAEEGADWKSIQPPPSYPAVEDLQPGVTVFNIASEASDATPWQSSEEEELAPASVTTASEPDVLESEASEPDALESESTTSDPSKSEPIEAAPVSTEPAEETVAQAKLRTEALEKQLQEAQKQLQEAQEEKQRISAGAALMQAELASAKEMSQKGLCSWSWECRACGTRDEVAGSVCDLCGCERGTGTATCAKASVEVDIDHQPGLQDAAWEAFCDNHIVRVRRGEEFCFSCDLCQITVETREQVLDHVARWHRKRAASAAGNETATQERSKKAAAQVSQTCREESAPSGPGKATAEETTATNSAATTRGSEEAEAESVVDDVAARKTNAETASEELEDPTTAMGICEDRGDGSLWQGIQAHNVMMIGEMAFCGNSFECKAHHQDWSDFLIIYQNGAFRRSSSRPDFGWWLASHRKLTLKWKRWRPEVLTHVRGGSKFVTEDNYYFTLSCINPPSWFSKHFATM